MSYASESVNDQMIVQEESWLETCRSRGWVCTVCGDFPTDMSYAPAYTDGLCPRCTDTLPE